MWDGSFSWVTLHHFIGNFNIVVMYLNLWHVPHFQILIEKCLTHPTLHWVSKPPTCWSWWHRTSWSSFHIRTRWTLEVLGILSLMGCESGICLNHFNCVDYFLSMIVNIPGLHQETYDDCGGDTCRRCLELWFVSWWVLLKELVRRLDVGIILQVSLMLIKF